MAFSEGWDEVYKRSEQDSIWPWSDLVGYVMRYARPAGPEFRVLELGCGAGANIPFLLSLGVDYFGIEGSRTMVDRLHRRHPSLQQRIVAGDFTREIPFEGRFDLVVDRSSLTHNATCDIVRCLDALHARLKPGGTFIGIDWFSTSHPDFLAGTETVDDFTRSGFQSGRFNGVGRVHFSDQPHLVDLFRRFDFLTLEHKIVKRHIPDDNWSAATWNLAVRKKQESS